MTVKNTNKTYKYIWIAVWVFIFLCALGMNLVAVFENLGQDEGVFLTIARGLNNGLLPYRDFFDHKPPGLYFFLAFFNHFITSPMVFRAILLLVNVSTATLVLLTANKLFRYSGYCAFIFYLAAIPLFQGDRIIAEPLLALLLSFSLYLIISKKYLVPVYALSLGLMSALLISIKQPGIVNALIFLGLVVFSKNKKIFAWYLYGFLTALSVFALWLGLNNLTWEFWHQSVVLNFTNYPRENLLFVVNNILRLIYHTYPIWVLAIIGATIGKKILSREISWLLILSTVLPVPLFLGRHYEHYWLQILPMLAIFGSIAFAWIIERRYFPVSMIVTVLVMLNIIGNLVFFWWQYQNHYRPIQREQEDVLKYLNSTDSKYLLAENQFSIYYFLSPKKPLNKHLYITEVNNLSEQSEERTIDALVSNPDTIVLWPNDPNYAHAKKLQEYILANYRREKIFYYNGLAIYKRSL